MHSPRKNYFLCHKKLNRNCKSTKQACIRKTNQIITNYNNKYEIKEEALPLLDLQYMVRQLKLQFSQYYQLHRPQAGLLPHSTLLLCTVTPCSLVAPAIYPSPTHPITTTKEQNESIKSANSLSEICSLTIIINKFTPQKTNFSIR